MVAPCSHVFHYVVLIDVYLASAKAPNRAIFVCRASEKAYISDDGNIGLPTILWAVTINAILNRPRS